MLVARTVSSSQGSPGAGLPFISFWQAYSPFPVRRQPFDSPKDLSSTDIGIGDQRKTGADASDTATRSVSLFRLY